VEPLKVAVGLKPVNTIEDRSCVPVGIYDEGSCNIDRIDIDSKSRVGMPEYMGPTGPREKICVVTVVL